MTDLDNLQLPLLQLPFQQFAAPQASLTSDPLDPPGVRVRGC
jgi:hypothetical protein